MIRPLFFRRFLHNPRAHQSTRTSEQQAVIDWAQKLLRTPADIPLCHIDIRTTRSSGPGGQHVNTNETRVEMRVSLSPHQPHSHWLPAYIRNHMLTTHYTPLHGRISLSTYQLIITSQEHRSQFKNHQDCLKKIHATLHHLIQSTIPRELDPAHVQEQAERVQRMSEAFNERRMDGKKKHAQRKALRRTPRLD